MKQFYTIFFLIILTTVVANAQVHSNDNLWFNNGALITVQAGTLVTLQGDMTNSKAGQSGTQLDNNGFIWLQGNAYGDNTFKQTGSGTLRLQNKTSLYVGLYESEGYQVIQGGYSVKGNQSAIGAEDDGSFFNLELNNQAGLVFIKRNTDVRGSVDFKPGTVTVDAISIPANAQTNKILTYDPGTAATPATFPANGSNYTAVFGMMNQAPGLANFKNLSTNLMANTTKLDSAFVQGKLRRAINGSTGGAYGFPLGLEPSNSSTAARGIQFANLDFVRNNYDVITGFFQQGSDNTVLNPGIVCPTTGGYFYYGASHHGEWTFNAAIDAVDEYTLTIYPQDYGNPVSSKYFITKDNLVPSNGVQSCLETPQGLFVSGLQGFSEFGFAGGGGVLPVKLENFVAEAQGNTVLVKWSVLEESGVDYYEVAHSTDGKNFFTIGSVHGTERGLYSFVHNNPIQGQNFYYLKTINKDGGFEYGPIRNVQFNKAGQVLIYPNPAKDVLNIAVTTNMINKAANIAIVAADGRLLMQKNIASLKALESINVNGLPNGLYLVRIATANEVLYKPVNVMK